MGKTTKKRAEKFTDQEGREGFHFHCPGCDMTHSVYTKGEGVPIWTSNNNEHAPTFNPSIRATWQEQEGEKIVDKQCHSYVTLGRIMFLADCTHDLAGKTIDLPTI